MFVYQTAGPSCSKQTMSLVNVKVKTLIINKVYMLIFLLKNCDFDFAFAKATHIFFSAKIHVI